MKTKTLDCVEMKRKGGRYVYNQVKDMTPEEELAYWRSRSKQLDAKIKKAGQEKGSAKIRPT
jgi:hypothetical protein